MQVPDHGASRMNTTLDELHSAVLSLPEVERARLAAYRRGELAAVAAEEVLDKARAMVVSDASDSSATSSQHREAGMHGRLQGEPCEPTWCRHPLGRSARRASGARRTSACAAALPETGAESEVQRRGHPGRTRLGEERPCSRSPRGAVYPTKLTLPNGWG